MLTHWEGGLSLIRRSTLGYWFRRRFKDKAP